MEIHLCLFTYDDKKFSLVFFIFEIILKEIARVLLLLKNILRFTLDFKTKEEFKIFV